MICKWIKMWNLLKKGLKNKEIKRLRDMWDRIMAPNDVHVLIAGFCEYVTSYAQRDFVDVLQVKKLEKEKLSWIIWVGLVSSQRSLQGKEGGRRIRVERIGGFRDALPLVWRIEEGTTSKGMQEASWNGKMQAKIPYSCLQQEDSTVDHLDCTGL